MSDRDTVQDFEDAYKNAINYWGTWQDEARTDLKYYLGDQWSATDKAFAARTRRELKTINKIKRVVKLIGGFQRKHRLAIKVDPIALAMNDMSEMEQKTAGQMSALLQNEMAKPYGAYLAMSQAFSGAVVVGLNLVELYLNYNDDLISGDLRYSRVPFNSFLLDPDVSKLDLEDCDYILQRKYLPKRTCQALVPARAGDIEKIRPKGYNDGKYTYTPRVKGMDNKDLWRYDVFYRRDTKRRKVVVDRETGEHFTWENSRRKLQEFMNTVDPTTQMPYHELFAVVTRFLPAMRQIILVEDEVMYDDADVLGINDYPFVPIWGYFDPEHDKHEEKLQGIVRAMRDPQIIVNKRYAKLEDIMDKLAYGGLKAKEDALVNNEQAYQVGHGLPLWVRKERSLEDVQDRQMPQVPQGLFSIYELGDKMILDVGMVTDELLGDPSSDSVEIAGVLSKLRQAAGLTVLQDVFDNYRESKRMLGEKGIKVIQAHYQPAKVRQILNEEPTKNFYDRAFPRMNCTVGEGILSDSQRQMYHFQILQYKQMGAPIPWSEVIDTAPLEGRERLREVVAKEEQANAEMAKANMQAQQVLQELTMAEAKAKISTSELNQAKIQGEIAEAFLDRVKALGEMEELKASINNMDAGRIANMLKAMASFTQATKPDPQPANSGMTKR